jgi:hypothetical protein
MSFDYKKKIISQIGDELFSKILLMSKLRQKEYLYRFSQSVYLHCDIIRENPDLEWYWHHVTINPSISIKFILENASLPWYWNILNKRHDFTLDLIDKHPSLKMSDLVIGLVLMNKNITLEMILNSKIQFSGYDLSYNPNLSWEYLQQHMDMRWTWHLISRQPYITCEIIISNPKINWDFYCLSVNPNINWEFIMVNIDKDWDWKALSRHPLITCEIINSNPQMNWCWLNISRNPNLTLEFIKANKDKNWSWEYISGLKIITWEIIETNPELPWYICSFVCNNPNIDFDMVKTNPELSQFSHLFQNPFELEFEKRRAGMVYSARSKMIKSRLNRRVQSGCSYSKSLISII